MRPKTFVTPHPGVHGTPNEHHASGASTRLPVQSPLEIRRQQYPVFSDESSPTEYTSSSGAEDVYENGNGNCVESKPEDGARTQPRPRLQAPTSVLIRTGYAVSGSSSKGGGVILNGQTAAAARPLIVIPKSTPFKERHEKDENGKTIVVVDLEDSDEETDAAPSNETSPLCTKCQLDRPPKQPEPQVSSKAADNEEVAHTPKVNLVVDLSGVSSQVNHTRLAAGEVSTLQKCATSSLDVMFDVSSKPAGTQQQVESPTTSFSREHKTKTVGKQVEAGMEFTPREHMKTALFNSNGKQAEMVVDLSKEQMKKTFGKHVEAGMECSPREHMKTAPLNANGKQAETVVYLSKVHMKSVSSQAEAITVEISREQMKKTISSNGKRTETKVEISREHVKTVMEPPHMEFSAEAVSPAAEESEDEASTLSEDYRRGHAEGHHVEAIRPDWSPGALCDLCERGPSLSLGAWYSWCCGNPSLNCKCSYEDQQRKKRTLMWKGGKSWKATDPPYPWSGKVHKLCGLWSAEVFEDANQPWRIMKLWAAVQRSRKSKCSDPDCGLFGATLGCRVASCKKNFHYPCADKLSVLVKVRMWDGLMKPIACKDHRHVVDILDDVKLVKEKKEPSKKRKRGKKGVLASTGAGSSSKLEVRTSSPGGGDGDDVINIDSSGDEDSPHESAAQEVIRRLNSPNVFSSRLLFTNKSVGTSDRWPRARNSGPMYLGQNLLCTDFSGGLEPIGVPCTNDVDCEPPPYLEYITKSRYQGRPLGSRHHSHPLLERQAKACDGCAVYDPDDPVAPVSIHIPFERREDDFREDWLRERMYGRLPYDKYARLVIGTDFNELVECNDRCKCGDSCINREMQKGLRTPIELYKTENKGWAVRTLVPVPRGQFVIEYVGEMLTQDQAQRYGQIYDEIKRSYLYDLDYPESKRTPDFTLDGFHASNVARFINHSCDANLKIYRVYVETTYKWLSHIGMYAMRDIEAGEELSYDYNYGRHDLQVHDGNSNNNLEAAKQKIDHGNDSTHIKCHCGAKNCREWLWRPMHTGDESEDE